MNEDAKLAAKKGAALLDEHRPGWAQEINRKRLNMGTHCNCVLGQLYGRFMAGLKSLPEADEIEHGFDLQTPRPVQWHRLDKAWLYEIDSRLP